MVVLGAAAVSHQRSTPVGWNAEHDIARRRPIASRTASGVGFRVYLEGHGVGRRGVSLDAGVRGWAACLVLGVDGARLR